MRCLCSLLCTGFFFIWFGASGKAQNAEPIAETILQRMTETYAGFSSYQDSGVVRRVPSDLPIANFSEPSLQTVAMQAEELVSFRTYYSRRNKLRFEWMNSKQKVSRQSVLWFDGRRAYLWKPAEPDSGSFEFTSHRDFGLQLDDAISPSLGSAFFIPTLLVKGSATSHGFPDILSTATHVSIAREELIDGELCYVVKAELLDVPWLLWIGKKSFLLRKTRTLYSARVFDPSNRIPRQAIMAEEIHTNIKINRGVPKGYFIFRPKLRPQDDDSTRQVYPKPRS